MYLATGIRILDDPRGFKAQRAVEQLDAEPIRYWVGKRAGRDPDAELRYERARRTAQQLGFSYAPAQEAAWGLPVEEFMSRIETLEARGTVERAHEVSAVLGGEATPVFMVGSMVDEFERIVVASLVLKSERQRKKRRVPKDTALAKYIDRRRSTDQCPDSYRHPRVSIVLAGTDRERRSGDRYGEQEHRAHKLDVSDDQ